MKNEFYKYCVACAGTGMLNGKNCLDCELEDGISLGLKLTEKGAALWTIIDRFERAKARQLTSWPYGRKS